MLQPLKHLEQMDQLILADISLFVVNSVDECISKANSQHKLPSAAQCAMWTAFHKLRCGSEVLQVWDSFTKQYLPDECQNSRLILQLLLDRVLKNLLHNKAKSKETEVDQQLRPLTSIESNAIRYMAGYVVFTLHKRNKKPTKNPELKEKQQFCVKILEKMKTSDLPGEVDTIHEYTRLWSELIDRGGLYHINDKVCNGQTF